MERVTITTEDGVTIVGLHAAGRRGGPTALLLHMMPATKESWSAFVEHLIGEGFLLSASAIITTAAVKLGATFVRVALQHGSLTTQALSQILIQDYVSSNQPATYPGTNLKSSLDGKGLSIVTAQTDPDPGADFEVSVAAHTRLLIHAIDLTYTASAVAATRKIALILEDGANIMIIASHPTTVTASQTVGLQFSTFQPANELTNRELCALSGPILLLGSQTLIIATTNIQVADQLSAITTFTSTFLEV